MCFFTLHLLTEHLLNQPHRAKHWEHSSEQKRCGPSTFMAQWEPQIVNKHTPPKQGIQIVISAGKGKYIQGAVKACVSRMVQPKGSGTSLQTDH